MISLGLRTGSGVDGAGVVTGGFDAAVSVAGVGASFFFAVVVGFLRVLRTGGLFFTTRTGFDGFGLAGTGSVVEVRSLSVLSPSTVAGVTESVGSVVEATSGNGSLMRAPAELTRRAFFESLRVAETVGSEFSGVSVASAIGSNPPENRTR